MSKISREALLEMAREAMECSVVMMRENAITSGTTPPSEMENAPQFDKTECFLEHFAELVAAADRKEFAKEFGESVARTLESLAATTRMPTPPIVINNLDMVYVVDFAVSEEREACAKLCEEFAHQNWDYIEGARLAAETIRARGEK